MQREKKMAIKVPPAPDILTYQQYMAEEEICLRYDIIEGVRIYIPGPTWRHQRIADKIARNLLAYEESSGIGMALSSPFDVLIRRIPKLQIRQPDVLFITHAQLAQGGSVPARGPMEIAPELVVEILSDSERQSMIAGKLADYIAIGVKEAWLVRPDAQTLEVVQLTASGPVSVATYNSTQRAQSVVFSDLTVSVAACCQ
jgi:Uma2 family endonuclease